MPKHKKDLPKKQAKRGNLPLPVDVIKELREWKLAYEEAWSDPAPDGKLYTMTYEQLLRRLMEGVKRLDPEVWAAHEAARKTREEQEEMMADFRRSFWSELKSTKAKLDSFYEEMVREIAEEGNTPAPAGEEVKEEEGLPVPEDIEVNPTEGEVWDMRYFFTNEEGEELEAFVGDKAAFYCKLNGRNTGMNTMMYNGWKLMNDAGVELTKEQAEKISARIKAHNAKA